jgi:signal peptidase I
MDLSIKSQGNQERRRTFFHPRFILHERRFKTRLWAWLLILSIPGFYLFEEYILSTGRIIDTSMLPTLHEGEWFWIHKWPYRFRAPHRGEIVVFKVPGRGRWHYVKRIIALPKDTLAFRQGQVYLNGGRLEEPYAKGPTLPDMGPIEIPPDACFVLGDNRLESEDSRQLGPIPLSHIQGTLKPRRKALDAPLKIPSDHG